MILKKLCQKSYVLKRGSNKYQNIIINRSYQHGARKLIIDHTEITNNHLTPEISLHLITPNCKLWHSRGEDSPFTDPFWAFYWPGGQVLSRYILDHKNLFEGKSVIDIGSGCGATSIACSLAGCKHVLANDIDSMACECIDLNSELNKTRISVSQENLIGQDSIICDVLLLGDMFYDELATNTISDWLDRIAKNTTTILIGDPGRYSFKHHPIKEKLTNIFTCKLPDRCQLENNGLTKASVWQYKYS